MLCENPLLPIAASYLPQHEPSGGARRWERCTPIGRVRLSAPGAARLPWGSAARVLLYHLYGRACLAGDRRICLDQGFRDSLRRIAALDERFMHEQLLRLGQVEVLCQLAPAAGGPAYHSAAARIIEELDLSEPLTGSVLLGEDCWWGLTQRAVPLPPAAVARLAAAPLALDDVYAWCAATLPDAPRKERVGWDLLQSHFAAEPSEPEPLFRRRFHEALQQVKSVYEHARLALTAQGLLLQRSPAPLIR